MTGLSFSVAPMVLNPRPRPEREQQIRTHVAGALFRRWPGFLPGDPSGLRAAVGNGPLTVSLTRVAPQGVSPGTLRDVLEPVRAELTAWLGTPSRLRWRLLQTTGAEAVLVAIEQVAP